MNFKKIIPDKTLSLFVRNIWVFESNDKNIKTNLPFFADGHPGLMVQQTENGLTVNPHNKVMPEIFLYGQTIKPIELEILGPYTIIIFQLYPFVLASFFNVLPKSINDDCYYLDDTLDSNITEMTRNISVSKEIKQRIKLSSSLLLYYFEKKKQNLDFQIRQSIEVILMGKGQDDIRSIAKIVDLNIRTFERRFSTATGLSPKQFSKIIQFQASLRQLSLKDFNKLTDIVYENGFSDQSHFIRVFKAFTGKTPKTFKN